MTQIEQLQIDLFQIVEQQAVHQAELSRLEQLKVQKYEELKKLRAQAAEVQK